MLNLDELYEKYGGDIDLDHLYDMLLRHEIWKLTHRSELAEYRREYRQRDPEKTREQWRKDTARYRAKQDPDELRERNRQYGKKHRDMMRLFKKGLSEQQDDVADDDADDGDE